MKITKATFIKLIAFILIISLTVPVPANAVESDAVMPLASYYLDAYSAYVYVTGSGQVQVWFEVMGTDDMDEIGALSIILYESSDNTNWDDVETFLHESTSDMLFEDDYYVSSHVSWKGTYGKYYKAHVTVWAGKNGSGDSRSFWAYMP